MRLIVVSGVLATTISASYATDFSEDFSAGKLDSKWCSCQIAEDRPVTFDSDPQEAGDKHAQITVDPSIGDNTCEENECEPAESAKSAVATTVKSDDDFPEDLGPSFIEGLSDHTVLKLGTPVIQRQEVRIAEDLQHDSAATHEYAITFRISKPNTSTRTRWITAQWKQEPLPSYGKGWSPSPFLAQRYDGGVLYLTVQDENCRCLIASAEAPNQTFKWEEGALSKCKLTYPKKDEDQACTSTLVAHYGADPWLKSPSPGWTEIRYLIKAGREKGDFIEVHQDGRFIVRISGKIGYVPAAGTTMKTKFKMGHYRNYMPSKDVLEVDSIKVSPK
ncbi:MULTISPECIES: heparin lyase I family protein [unclassified Sinorhizobium]|uniref:heparin lyase I family protein n=1 Tax=unclassified Sinorhizobium TaxID=2613772 RepID=UPI0024C2B407|nr:MULTISPECIES: heparin lyase I family protein [unclassified Sinorhizobium]MDK1374184.1 heparin lyase I family protein [Sinorhizobium sp. 6-70]MDK1480406.1 heparin lyase I family protein [Sinorhizobium sp. 6-117]